MAQASCHLRIRLLHPNDIPFVEHLRTLAGWNQTRSDLQCLMDYEPTGCFLAEWDGVPVGTATTTCYGRDIAWIGMILVLPEFRRRGIGTELMRKCLDYLSRKQIRCIKLDASRDGRPVYERLGFQAEYEIHRWERDGDGSFAAPMTGNKALLLDLNIDRRVFGADRYQLLAGFAIRSRIVVRNHDCDTLAGYGMIRSGDRAAYIGPVVARDSETGTSIAEELFKQETARLFWDIPLVCPDAVGLAESSGFRSVRSLTRMWLGELIVGQPQLQFGICDLATG
ncbi:MAG: GNAT family N-acetyltransferase [Phycisphaera sp. RhM]|nr:GNAT family N-acetyltransferase [Phycisphaera sp. RhM]